MRAGLDITPAIPGGRQLIEGYGDGRFRIDGQLYVGSVIVWPERTTDWAVSDPAAITIAALAPVTSAGRVIDLLLVGCGRRFVPAPQSLRAELAGAGIVLEWMDTGAACRTFNVLLAEDRRVAAALVAV